MTPEARSLLDAMLHAAWLVEPQRLEVIAANPSAGTLLGCAAADLVGQSMRTLAATPEDLCFWDELAGGGAQALLSDTLVRRFDGSTAAVTRRIAPVQTTGGTLYLVSLHDRSEQQRTERALGGIL